MNGRNVYIFALASVTYAIKAQSVLRAQGISCAVIKTPKDMGRGCGYSIKVSGNGKRAAEILSDASIEIKASRPKIGIKEGGE